MTTKTKNAPQPILHTIQTGGSGTGHGYYSRYASGCPLSASLDFSAVENTMSEKSGRNLGTIAHALHEMRWKKQLDPQNSAQLAFIEFSQHVDEENREGATRVVRYFNEVLPEEDALGTVLEVESQYPRDDADKKTLDALYNVPFTMRLDLVTKLTKAHIDRLKKKPLQWTGSQLKPGKTLWDYKHYGRREGNLIDKATGSTQYASYMQAYNELHPKDPIVQTVQVSIFTTKEIDIWLTVVPVDTRMQEVAAKLIIVGAQNQQNYSLETLPSESNCFPYGSLCRHLKDSKCDRLGPTNLGLVQLRKAGLAS